jgi:hypothetical protein
VKFEFRKMSDEEAQEFGRWRYDPPYDFYDSVVERMISESQCGRALRGERKKSRRRVFTSRGRSSATSGSRPAGARHAGGSGPRGGRLGEPPAQESIPLAPNHEHRSLYPFQ